MKHDVVVKGCGGHEELFSPQHAQAVAAAIRQFLLEYDTQHDVESRIEKYRILDVAQSVFVCTLSTGGTLEDRGNEPVLNVPSWVPAKRSISFSMAEIQVEFPIRLFHPFCMHLRIHKMLLTRWKMCADHSKKSEAYEAFSLFLVKDFLSFVFHKVRNVAVLCLASTHRCFNCSHEAPLPRTGPKRSALRVTANPPRRSSQRRPKGQRRPRLPPDHFPTAPCTHLGPATCQQWPSAGLLPHIPETPPTAQWCTCNSVCISSGSACRRGIFNEIIKKLDSA